MEGGFELEVDEEDVCLNLQKYRGENFSAEDQVILQWMALLVNNRAIRLGSPIERRGKAYLIEHFLPDISKYDYLIGYRADDSYFSYARAFLSNTLTSQL